jgi:hypothetical protein
MLCRMRAAPLVAIFTGLAALGTTMPASADVSAMGGSADFPRILSDGVKWVAKTTDATTATRAARDEADEKAARATDGEGSERRRPMVLLPNPWLLAAPPAETGVERLKEEGPFPRLHPSLVARDWTSAYAVIGKDLPSDNVRVTRSSRMLVSRMSIGDGRIKPFAHFAVGEWRFDPYLLPFMPRNQEYATQFSGGVSIELFKGTTFVWETDYTVLVRASREPQNLPSPRVLATFAILETHL